LYSKVAPCPNSAFTLTKQTSFEIIVGNVENPVYLYKFKGINVKFKNLFNFQEEWSNRINFHIVPEKYKFMNISIINDRIEQLGKMTVDLTSRGEQFHKKYSLGIAEFLFIIIFIWLSFKQIQKLYCKFQFQGSAPPLEIPEEHQMKILSDNRLSILKKSSISTSNKTSVLDSLLSEVQK